VWLGVPIHEPGMAVGEDRPQVTAHHVRDDAITHLGSGYRGEFLARFERLALRTGGFSSDEPGKNGSKNKGTGPLAGKTMYIGAGSTAAPGANVLA